jgi:hypothetical protein
MVGDLGKEMASGLEKPVNVLEREPWKKTSLKRAPENDGSDGSFADGTRRREKRAREDLKASVPNSVEQLRFTFDSHNRMAQVSETGHELDVGAAENTDGRAACTNIRMDERRIDLTSSSVGESPGKVAAQLLEESRSSVSLFAAQSGG